MNRRLLSAVAISVLCSSPASAETETPRSDAPAGEQDRSPLHELGIELEGETRPITAIEVVGLRTIAEHDLWSAVTRPTPPFPFSQGAALIETLDRTGAFARIEPRVRVSGSRDLTLVIRLQEQPQLRAVTLRGLAEFPESEALREVLGGEPSPGGDSQPNAAPAWFAGLGDGATVRPGILRGGPAGAARRLLGRLFASGYSMAKVAGHMSADGALELDVDEGRIGEIRLVGASASQQTAILEALELPSGRIFNIADVRDALARLRRVMASMHPDDSPRPTRGLP
jgi:outer membrane protein assembly factor BamA